MPRFKGFLVCGLGFLAGMLVDGLGADWVNSGPLFDTFESTLSQGRRTEALGPFFYFEREETQKTWAIPPLLSRAWDPVTDFTLVDFAFPLVTYRRFGTEYRWQLGQVISFAGGQDQQQTNTSRLTLFPIYFQQWSSDPSQTYTAVFPFYGHLVHRVLRDEIYFILFPLYGQSRKKDVVTDNYLYPFFHVRHGNALQGWQFWPLLGHEHKDPTTLTNGFGDTELSAGHDRSFVLWPFFFLQRSGIGTENPQSEQALFPVYSVLRSPHRDSTTLLWPFFTHITDRERKISEWDTPWPLVVFARGEGKTTSRVWPFYSRAHNANLQSDFFLWPLYKYNRVHSSAVDRERTRLLFFLYSDKSQKDAESGQSKRRIDLWPLFTRTRDYAGSSRLQVLSLLEPLLPDSASIERDYSPVWSLWRAEKNPRTQASSQSLLWNLYRHETTAESRKCSLLLGLFQYQSGSEGKRLRLLYIPVMKTRPAPRAAAK